MKVILIGILKWFAVYIVPVVIGCVLTYYFSNKSAENTYNEKIQAHNLSIETKFSNINNNVNQIKVNNSSTINVINENVIKVEKEIVNIQESLSAFYSAQKSITLHKSDISKKIISVKNKDSSIQMLVVLLDDVPIQNSIRISTDKGDISPSQINQFLNLIIIRMDMDARWFFTYHTNSCNIQYVPKSNVTHSLVGFDDVDMFFNDNNVFKIKPLTNELIEIMGNEFRE